MLPLCDDLLRYNGTEPTSTARVGGLGNRYDRCEGGDCTPDGKRRNEVIAGISAKQRYDC